MSNHTHQVCIGCWGRTHHPGNPTANWLLRDSFDGTDGEATCCYCGTRGGSCSSVQTVEQQPGDYGDLLCDEVP